MKNPMSLRNLPDYLKSLKNNESIDDSLVVDMGQVISETPYKKIFTKYSIAILILFIVFGVGHIGGVYYESFNKSITVVLISNTDIKTVSDIIASDGADIISIEQMTDSSYKIQAKYLKKSFIEKLKNHKDIKKIEVE